MSVAADISLILIFGLVLGAFVAGLVLSESEYAHQALSDVVPLRDIFGIIFFASVGMLLDPEYLVEYAPEVLLLVEFDHHRAEQAREAGYQVVSGDAAQDPVLEAAGIGKAKMALFTVPSAVDSIAVARRIHELAPSIPLIVRTDTLEDIRPLLGREGVTVVQPEFEAAMEMTHEALLNLGLEQADIEPLLAAEREHKFREFQESESG